MKKLAQNSWRLVGFVLSVIQTALLYRWQMFTIMREILQSEHFVYLRVRESIRQQLGSVSKLVTDVLQHSEKEDSDGACSLFS